MPTAEPEEPHYELVMPFVTVVSNGGPHDDDSYSAGWEMGALDFHLSLRQPVVTTVILTANTPQAELISMKHGYAIDYRTTEVEGWTEVHLTLVGEGTDAE